MYNVGHLHNPGAQMIHILTDSCADLNAAILEERQIRSIPLHVFVSDHNYFDGDLTLQELFSLVSQTGQLPKTSAPSIQEFVDFFKPAHEGIFIGISSTLSATFQNSLLAIAELNGNNIKLIDSLNLSTGIGLLVLKAADLRDAGRDIEQIAAEIQLTVPKTRTSFMIDTMDYLYKGGRCTALQAIFGSLLKIRPIIEVHPDGILGVKGKVRGTRRKGLDTLLEDFQANSNQADLRRVFITHTDCPEDAAFLRQEMMNIAPVQDVIITTAGATIASHCGPGTIGILYSLV